MERLHDFFWGERLRDFLLLKGTFFCFQCLHGGIDTPD